MRRTSSPSGALPRTRPDGTSPDDAGTAASRARRSARTDTSVRGSRSRHHAASRASRRSPRGPRTRPLIPWTVRIRSALSRRARGLGLLLVTAAALLAVWASPGSTAGQEGFAVTVTKDLAVGDVFEESAVRIEPASGPGAISEAEAEEVRDGLIGAAAAIPVTSGDRLGRGHAVSEALSLNLPPDRVAAAVRVRDPESLRVLSPGREVLALTPATPEAPGREIPARVLWIPPAEQNTGWQGSTSGGEDLLLVAVTAEDARALAEAEGAVSVVMRP